MASAPIAPMTTPMTMLRVAYQGEPGAYSEQALRAMFAQTDASSSSSSPAPSIDVVSVPQVTFAAVFEAVAAGKADCAVVPIENTLGGSIHDNYDLLVRHDVVITHELNFRVSHCLMALPGVPLHAIKTVMSHPQALAQCQDFIQNLGVHAEKQYDTAGSAKLIAQQRLTDTAAIASSLAAQVYGLNILERGIEDDANNFTRFLLLIPPHNLPLFVRSTSSMSPTSTLLRLLPNDTSAHHRPFKTSIVFALKDEPGVLFKALSVFALRDIHLTKIESRPGKKLSHLRACKLNEFHDVEVAGSASTSDSDSAAATNSTATAATPNTRDDGSSGASFKYLFYVDFLAHAHETRAQNALGHLREIAPFLRVLGSYAASSSSSPTLLHNTAANGGGGSGTLAPQQPPRLRIGIVGFGTFGQFLAKAFVRQGHAVFATSRTDYRDVADGMGVRFDTDPSAFCAHKLDCVVLSVSILSFEETVRTFPWSQLAPCLVVDVLSVKMHPKNVLTTLLPPAFDVLCTHPMFGPDSGKYSWKGLPCMYEQVRVRRTSPCARFLDIFVEEGCRMLEMSCELHDSYAAGSQFLTHTTGRVLAKLGCESTPINTKGFSMLLEVIGNTARDSFDLYKGLFAFNPHSRAQLDGFQRAFEELRANLLAEGSGGSGSSNATTASAPTTSTPATAPTPFNPRVLAMQESKTAQVTDLAKALASKGIKVVSLSVGEPLDVPTPEPIVEATVQALRQGHTKYTPVAGLLELRRAICAKLERENGLAYRPEQIVVSNGAKQSILQALMALSCPGDEVIIPAPYWVSYPDMCTLCGSTPVIVPTTASEGYVMSAEALRRAITPRTKMVILCSPSNPTGAVYSRAALDALADVVRAHPCVWVLSDEIYEHLLYDGATHTSFASLPGMYDRTVVINGFSKCFAMTGFRLGYVAAPLAVAELCNKIQGQITSCASSVSQHAGIAALSMDSGPFVRDMLVKLQAKRDMVVRLLRSVPNVRIDVPNGAFYAMPTVSAYFGRWTPDRSRIDTSDDLCVHLLAAYHVALVPGSAFGAPDTVRISYASGEEEVRAGVEGLAKCLRELE